MGTSVEVELSSDLDASLPVRRMVRLTLEASRKLGADRLLVTASGLKVSQVARLAAALGFWTEAGSGASTA